MSAHTATMQPSAAAPPSVAAETAQQQQQQQASAALSPSPVLQLSYEQAPATTAAPLSASDAASPSSTGATGDGELNDPELARAAALLAAQPASGVRDWFVKRYETESVKNWDRFYKRNADRFYRDRHYLTNEFKELSDMLDADQRAREGSEGAASPSDSVDSTEQQAAESQDESESSPSASPPAATSSPPAPLLPISEPTATPAAHHRRLLEVGCGVGNALFPLLRLHPQCFFYGVDCSRNAVQTVQNHPDYLSSGRAAAWVCDLVSEELPPPIRDNALDFATLIFVLSAIHPDKMLAVLRKVQRALKKDEGVLFIRDYALYDLAQLRFATSSKLGENWYVRQDGTRSYFFTLEQLSDLLEQAGFEVLEQLCVRKTVRNRKEKSDMSRRFVQIRAKAVDRAEPLAQDSAAADASSAPAVASSSSAPAEQAS